MAWPAESPSAEPPPERPSDPSPASAIDVQALAEKVYRLMLAEARLEIARGGRVRRREA